MSWNGIQQGWKKVSGTTKQALDHLARKGPGGLEGTHLSPERDRTDQSLRAEREKTDEAVAARQDNVARHANAVVDLARNDADQVLSLARENADAVLDTARDKADETLDAGRHGVQPEAAVLKERDLADETLRIQRDDADGVLRQERAHYARTLERFLPLERESTDRYLLSERIRSDDALANRDDFLAIVAHDLRDLIGGVVASSALLAKYAPADSAGGQDILEEAKRIERYAARMNRLIGDLVDVASIDAGKLSVTPANGDLALLIAEAVETFRPAASAKQVSLSTRMDAAPILAVFDHDRTAQVLANLISNSLKFTAQGGQVTVAAERDTANVCLSVLDTGCGIPAEALEHIFDRFSQAGRNDRRGLGLGLYISRCIVEAQGGRIWAEQPPAAGSRVCFTLPVRGAPR